MSDVRNDAKMALARYESSYAAFGVEACFTLEGLRDVQRYIDKLEALLEQRDLFIVKQGLWTEFVTTLEGKDD